MEFLPNPIKQALVEGRPVIGTMIVQERSPAIVQLLAQYGLDYLFIDMEHGPYSFETAADLIQVARLAGITPLVRVSDTQYSIYARVLDAGAQGIMTPRVETVEQVERILRFSRYPPLGQRGFSRLAAHLNYMEVDVPAYIAYANSSLVNIIQIETRQAVENIEALIAVPGVDGVIMGMDDLSLSLGIPGDTAHPLAEEMLERVVSACQARGMPWGLHIPDLDRLEKWIKRGMLLITYTSDIWIYQQALRDGVGRLRQAITRRG
jgi:2-dehydro-3-deoxyglucarate aldolase/4-hydroxy-2-oxoheptanedioate aldolase